MRNSKNTHALTLTELLVASILIGIVMLGIAAFSVTVRQIQDSTSKLTLLAMKTSGAMSIMSRKATLVVGDQSNPGIVLGDDTGAFPPPPTGSASTPTWIAFRNEGSNQTPGTYTDDKWYVYLACTKSGAGSGYNLWENIFDADSITGGLPTGISCAGAPSNSSAFRILDVLETYIFDFQADSDNFKFYVSLTLNSIDDITKASDPINNPRYSLTTRISPVAHSW